MSASIVEQIGARTLKGYRVRVHAPTNTRGTRYSVENLNLDAPSKTVHGHDHGAPDAWVAALVEHLTGTVGEPLSSWNPLEITYLGRHPSGDKIYAVPLYGGADDAAECNCSNPYCQV